MKKISIAKNENGVFFRVEGDYREYYDLENIKAHYPAMSDYLDAHRIEFERKLLQYKEKMEGNT